MVHQYFDEGFDDEFFRSSLPQLRTSPHMKAIVPEFNIATYDNMREIVKKTNKSIQVAVITSYSIHYTKLYEGKKSNSHNMNGQCRNCW